MKPLPLGACVCSSATSTATPSSLRSPAARGTLQGTHHTHTHPKHSTQTYVSVDALNIMCLAKKIRSPVYLMVVRYEWAGYLGAAEEALAAAAALFMMPFMPSASNAFPRLLVNTKLVPWGGWGVLAHKGGHTDEMDRCACVGVSVLAYAAVSEVFDGVEVLRHEHQIQHLLHTHTWCTGRHPDGSDLCACVRIGQPAD